MSVLHLGVPALTPAALLFLSGCGETTEQRAATGGAVMDEGVDEKVDEATD